MQTSVIIPNHDSPLVADTLRALREQGVPGHGTEVIVVGRDTPGAVPRDGSVRFLETQEPQKPSRARNRGVEAARGRRLLFTDADCRPAPGWAARLGAALEQHPVVGGAVSFPRKGNVWALADNIASFHALLPERRPSAGRQHPLGTLNLGVRRDAWDAVGPFDESLETSEDYDWFLRAVEAGFVAAFLPEVTVEHAAVRTSRRALEEHAAWYGRHFNAFRRKHPGVFGRGPTWRSRRLLGVTAPLKALTSAAGIFLRHPTLLSSWRALPGVVLFKRAWYNAVLDSWQEN